ncbi:MAG: glycosyl transferase family 1 [Anaerolineae bacterium]|nr:glycosyl transferase family 1 [Gloeobacterales cyanobacterium ES-bin-313]
MSHFGFLCPPVAGHLNPLCAVARELKLRGHKCTFIGVYDAQQRVLEEGLEFEVIAKESRPLGSLRITLAKLAAMNGLEALLQTIELFTKNLDVLFAELPLVLSANRFDLLVIDQTSLGCESIAEWLGIPYVHIANAIAQNFDDGVPPWLVGWDYDPSWLGTWRNNAGYAAGWVLGLPQLTRINLFRLTHGLTPRTGFDELYSPLAQISQMLQEFDFPRTKLPRHFHYVGPLRRSVNSSAQQIPFDWEKLDGRPLIYASLGTIQNNQSKIFETIAIACAKLDAQLVLSLGGGLDPSAIKDLMGSPIVVRYAPQLELISRSSLVITHAGLNTVLESLAQGVPLVCIPITNDQPAIAARVRHCGVGESIPLVDLEVANLYKVIHQVLTEQRYRTNAAKMQHFTQLSGGVTLAADICEKAVSTGKRLDQAT